MSAPTQDAAQRANGPAEPAVDLAEALGRVAGPLGGTRGPYFGRFGGRFVPEALVAALDELDAAFRAATVDPEFIGRLEHLHRTYTGRPSILTEARRFGEHAGGARILLKREDLNHTGSHKINNVLG